MEAISIYPELVTWKANKAGKVPVSIRIDINGQRIATDTISQRITPHSWDKVKKQVTHHEPNYQLINQIISTKVPTYQTYVLRRQTFGLLVTKDMQKAMARNGAAPDSFADFVEKVLETKTLKGGTGYTEETKCRYRDELKRLLQYKHDLTLDVMTADFLRQYRTWMQTIYLKKDGTKLAPNGIWNAFKFIRMVWNEAIQAQIALPEQNPFRSFKFDGYEQDLTKIKYLEREEADKIESCLTLPHLQPLTIAIGWRFLAMCVCGMRI